MSEYPIKDLRQLGLQEQSLEQLGTKKKSWFIDSTGKQFLFKIGRPGTGENWAEKAACELSGLLGLPHAEYDFAISEVGAGVLSPSFVIKPERLFHGNELLKKYRDNTTGVYKQRHHTVGRIFAMTQLSYPASDSPLSPAIKDGADVFAGYLLLDAWIGNQDRHDQNWGIIAYPPLDEIQPEGVKLPQPWPLRLAPTCDHASSLGRELSDEERGRRLRTRDGQSNVDAYVARSRSALFAMPSDSKPLLTIEAFALFAQRRPKAALFWLDRLLSINSNSLEEIFGRMPGLYMSMVAKEFALQILKQNKASLEAIKEKFDE